MNQEPQIAELLAKLPDRRRPDLVDHEQAAAPTYQQRERAQHVAVGVRDVAAAGEVGDRFTERFSVQDGQHSYNWEET